jgi:hypothetical protein
MNRQNQAVKQKQAEATDAGQVKQAANASRGKHQVRSAHMPGNKDEADHTTEARPDESKQTRPGRSSTLLLAS